MRETPSPRPVVSFDLDGVLAVWPFGVNPGISSRPKRVPPLPPDVDRLYDAPSSTSRFRAALEWLRFAWRRPDPDARAVLEALRRRARVVITTGRSASGRPALDGWLRRHGLADYVDAVHMSPKTLSTRQHKLATLRRIGARVHVDDDPTAIWYLVAHGVSFPVFREWPKTAGTTTPPGVPRIRRLMELLSLDLA